MVEGLLVTHVSRHLWLLLAQQSKQINKYKKVLAPKGKTRIWDLELVLLLNLKGQVISCMGMLTFNPTEVDVDGSLWAWGQPGLHIKFQDNQGDMVKPLSQNNRIVDSEKLSTTHHLSRINTDSPSPTRMLRDRASNRASVWNPACWTAPNTKAHLHRLPHLSWSLFSMAGLQSQ